MPRSENRLNLASYIVEIRRIYNIIREKIRNIQRVYARSVFSVS